MIVVATLALGAAMASPTVAATEELGGGVPGDPRMITSVGETARHSVVSPDGATIVYIQIDDHGSESVVARPAGGGNAITLSGPVAGGDVDVLTVSPDSEWVVYMADQNTPGKRELISVPIGGGQRNKLSGDMPAGGDVLYTSLLYGDNADSVVFTPDSTTVVFRADAERDNAVELFSTPIAGGKREKLHARFGIGSHVFPVELTSDGSRLVYIARRSGSSLSRLYSTPLRNWETTVLAPYSTTVHSFSLSADQASVFWVGTRDNESTQELSKVPITGGDSIQLSGSTVPDGRIGRTYTETGDGNYLIYAAEQEAINVAGVYAASVDGSSWRKLSPELPPRGGVGRIHTNPDRRSSQVSFLATEQSTGQPALYMADAAAGGPVKVNPALTGSSISPIGFDATGSRFIFTADSGADGAARTYSVATDSPWRLAWISRDIDDLLVIEGDLASGSPKPLISDDGSWVVYLGSQSWRGTYAVYASRIDGTGSNTLSGPPLSEFGPVSIAINRHGTHVRYRDAGSTFYVAIGDHTCLGRQATHVGTQGNDTISGTSGPDVIVGLRGADVLSGKAGVDVICGAGGNDVLNGGQGIDYLIGGAGADILRGKKGNDRLFGNSGDDRLIGAPGRDRIFGGSGNDWLFGGANQDSLWGGDGDDQMFGGTQADECDGGSGVDTAASCQTTNVP